MDTAIHPPFWSFGRTDSSEAPVATGPEPRPRRSPVFIHDAVTPWGGETLLLSLLRAQALAEIEDQR